MTRIIAAVMALAALPSLAAAGTPAPSAFGLWRNPRGTIDVRISPCGTNLCGTVARASREAEQDAHEAGVASLIGIQLLQGYRQIAANRWEGRVFVPDMGGTYSSRIVEISPTQLKISGCLVGGWICKSQLWTRD
ncbi:MAG: DUF2147 domain-containing protein [Sphingomicrobium sp.]